MPSQIGVPTRLTPAADSAATVEFVGAFMLRVVRHEQDGLSRACAVLAASSEMGIDPAAVLQAGAEE